MGNGPSAPASMMGYVTDMTPEQLAEHERHCRPDHGRKRNESEMYLRLGEDWFSDTGFINDTESLIDVARRDDATVVRLLGAEGHSIIGRALMMLCVGPEKIRRGAPEMMLTGFDVTKFDTVNKTFCGWQKCPFISHVPMKWTHDGAEKSEIMIGSCGHQAPSSGGSADVTVINRATGERFTFGTLLPHMIYHHHFYEGAVPHRVDPEVVVRVLGLTAEMK